MGPEEFAAACKQECDAVLRSYSDGSGATFVGEQLLAAGLNENQRRHVLVALSGALRDAFYTILLALDGAASLGGQQRFFRLADEENRPISGDGLLEAAAWEAFQQKGG